MVLGSLTGLGIEAGFEEAESGGVAEGVPGAVGDVGALAEEVQFFAELEGGGEVEQGPGSAEEGSVAALVAPAFEGAHEGLGGLHGASGDVERPVGEVDVLEGEAPGLGAGEAAVCAEEHEGAFLGVGFLEEAGDVAGAVDGAVVVGVVEGTLDAPVGVVGDEPVVLEEVVEPADLGEAVLVRGGGVGGGEPGAVVAGLGIADVQEGVAGFFQPAEVDAEAAEDVQVGGTAGLARQEGRQDVEGAVQVAPVEEGAELVGDGIHVVSI